MKEVVNDKFINVHAPAEAKEKIKRTQGIDHERRLA